MTEITLDAMIRRLSRTAEDIFNKVGEVDTLWLVDIPGKGQGLIVSPITGPPGESAGKIKNSLTDYMREFFEDHGVTRYVHASESWVGSEEDGPGVEGWITEHGSLKNYPGRTR